MSNHRICRVCWNCGSDKFCKLKPARMIYFSKDRECTKCGVVYTLPMPAGVKLLLLVVGIVFTVCFVPLAIVLALAIWVSIRAHELASLTAAAVSVLVLFIAVPLALIGVECLKQGIAGCCQHVTDPVDFSSAKD
jgi:hypothetical protein